MATESVKYTAPKLADMELSVKLPPPKVFHLPLEFDRLYEGLDDIGIGPRYFGHVRKGEYHLEFGGPKNEYMGYVLFDLVDDPADVVDGKVTVYGPDINELPPETSVPFGWHFKIWGKDVTHAHFEFLMRYVATGLTYMEGLMITGSLTEPWERLSKKAAPKYTWAKFAQAVRAYALTSLSLIEKFETVIITATPEVGGKEVIRPLREKAMERKAIYDAWASALEDQDVDTFYGCTLCQAIAPSHICVITPSTMPFCGVMSFAGAKATHELDPGGYVFPIPRGEVIDADLGCYSGVDELMYERSHEHFKHFYLNSVIRYPTTSCGCFEAIIFYIPEVDGLGLVQRRHAGNTPVGIPFSTLAGLVSGGEQTHGFKGTCLRYTGVKDFLRGDGGWNRVVWIPKDIKLEIAKNIPEEVYDKIATEEDCVEPHEIKEFLRQKKHPVVEKYWKDGEPQSIRVPPPGQAWAED